MPAAAAAAPSTDATPTARAVAEAALVTEVLPDRERDAAKDLGILNSTNALPQCVAPALAPAILAAGGGDYGALFLTAGAIALTGSIAILPLRGVR